MVTVIKAVFWFVPLFSVLCMSAVEGLDYIETDCKTEIYEDTCIFPFKYEGSLPKPFRKVFTKCTDFHEYGKKNVKLWCARTTDSNGVATKYGKCGPSCSGHPNFDKSQKYTRYGELCSIGGCGKRGKNYYWCWKQSGSWDYCSPDDTKEIYGRDCQSSPCRKRGEKYFWCWFKKGDNSVQPFHSTWSYCSPSEKYMAGQPGYTAQWAQTIGFSEPVNACIWEHTDKTLYNVDLDTCKLKCSSTTDYKSLEYSPARKTCWLSKSTRLTAQKSAWQAPCSGSYADLIFLEKEKLVMASLSAGQDIIDNYCKNTVSKIKGCEGRIFARFGTDKNGGGKLWRCYNSVKEGKMARACIDDKGKMTDCQEPDPAGGKYCTRDSQIREIFSTLGEKELSAGQDIIDNYCKNTVSKIKGCEGRIFARFGTDKNGGGKLWRCYNSVKEGKMARACIDNKGKMTDCREPDPAGGKYCTRDSQIKRIAGIKGHN